jgi:hypothetical protein
VQLISKPLRPVIRMAMVRGTPGFWASVLAFAWVSVVGIACSATSGGTAASNVGAGSHAGGSTASSTGGSTTAPGYVISDASTANGGSTHTAGDGDVVPCTNGDDCICPTLSVAVIGKHGVWGDASDSAFQDWLNSSSAGTARVDNYPTRTTFTPDFLAGYNVIILQGLGDDSNNGPWWTFSAAEVAAFQDWIENKGGGVISLSGYSGDSNEINAKNALFAFSGIVYNQENISPPCVIVDANNNKMCYRCGNPYQITEWNRNDPVIANLSLGVTMVGMDGGHTITAPADAHIAATTTNGSNVSNWLVGKLIGKGRVLVYADEWITYTNQWTGQGNQNDPSCTGFLPQDLYQIAQFWYNMIRWTQPNANCFKIVDNQQPVIVW